MNNPDMGFTFEFYRDNAGQLRVKMRQKGNITHFDTVIPSVEDVLANPKKYWDENVRTIVPLIKCATCWGSGTLKDIETGESVPCISCNPPRQNGEGPLTWDTVIA